MRGKKIFYLRYPTAKATAICFRDLGQFYFGTSFQFAVIKLVCFAFEEIILICKVFETMKLVKVPGTPTSLSPGTLKIKLNLNAKLCSVV